MGICCRLSNAIKGAAQHPIWTRGDGVINFPQVGGQSKLICPSLPSILPHHLFT
jgi:hypothetical protein